MTLKSMLLFIFNIAQRKRICWYILYSSFEEFVLFLIQEKSTVPDPHKKLFSKSDDLQSLLMQRCESDSNHEDSGEESDYYFSEEEDN